MSRPKKSLPTIEPITDWAETEVSVVSNTEALREMRAHSASVSDPDLAVPLPTPLNPPSDLPPVPPLHRIATVRKEQRVSLTQAAKSLKIDISEAQRQESETTDLSLSQLYRWREILDVPMGELIVEHDEIPTNPIRNRSQLVKIMKTVRAIVEVAHEERVQILAEILFGQMVDLMPELKSISAWPNVGQSREQRDLGQAVYRRFDASVSRRLDVE